MEEEQHCIVADDDDGPTEACDCNSGSRYESAPDSLKFMFFKNNFNTIFLKFLMSFIVVFSLFLISTNKKRF